MSPVSIFRQRDVGRRDSASSENQAYTAVEAEVEVDVVVVEPPKLGVKIGRDWGVRRGEKGRGVMMSFVSDM